MNKLTLPLVLTALAASPLASAIEDTDQKPTISKEAARNITAGTPDRFTGKVRVEYLFQAHAPARANGGKVYFEAGARTAWHTHPLGQTLIVTAGTGRIQFWGESIREIKTGDVVWIPPNIKHWHGAAPGTSMTHIAIQEQQEGKTVDWLELVSDEQYAPPQIPSPTSGDAGQKSRAQQLMGAITPKLAELTDNVLFADVWERQGLSKRDRSLVTVSALIAMNRPDQLKSHIKLGLQNGLTPEEISEAITQLAFYAGWPSGVTAATVTKDVLGLKD